MDKPLDKFFDEHYKWKAEKEKHREQVHLLKKAAHEEFYAKNKGWFKVLDIIAIIIVIANLLALVITGLLVVKENPNEGFTEGNPTQCQWNGFACHNNAWDTILPLLKFMGEWAVLAFMYIYIRNHTFSNTGMWILTGIIILYITFISIDTLHDLGLYLGKILFAGGGT